MPEFEAVLGGDDYRLVPKETIKALVAQIDKNGDGQASLTFVSFSFGPRSAQQSCVTFCAS